MFVDDLELMRCMDALLIERHKDVLTEIDPDVGVLFEGPRGEGLVVKTEGILVFTSVKVARCHLAGF